MYTIFQNSEPLLFLQKLCQVWTDSHHSFSSLIITCKLFYTSQISWS